MAKRQSRQTRRQQAELHLVSNNQRAREEGPKQKKWSIHDLECIKPQTKNQENMFRSWFEGDHIVAHGCAGSGKTFIALYLSLYEILTQKEHKKIIIVRSAVPSREIGFIPGSVDEKTAVYESPYESICVELVGRKSTYRDMKDAGLIEFITTSFIRGVTWDNAIVVVDEFQNMSEHEIDSIMTRIGLNTRVIFAGDTKYQCDIVKGAASGASQLLARTKTIKSFDCIEFTSDDIVRSQFVKDWIMSGDVF